MPFLKHIGGIVVALVIGLLTLYLLLFFFNKSESKRLTPPKVELEFLKKGNIATFPLWNEYAEFPPESLIRYKGRKENKVVFDVTYDIDSLAFRREPKKTHHYKSHLLLGGCSFIFGIGVNATETLSSFLRVQAPDINVFNMGHGGGGLHTQLRIFELVDVKKYAREESGTYIYFFFNDHLPRWLAHPSYLSWAQPEDVHFEWERGKLRSMPLAESRQFKAFQEVKERGLDKVFIKAKAAADYSDGELQDFIRGVAELKTKYLKLYPKGRFIFAFYPFMPGPEIVKHLIPYLIREKIEYYDFIGEFQWFVKKSGYPDAHFTVPIDGHHNRFFNNFFSGHLLQKLKLGAQ